MLISQQNCFQLQIDGCVCTSIAMKDLGLVDSAADTWWVISLSSQRLCPPRCSTTMLLEMLQELEDIVFACPTVGGHILWPKINGNLQNPVLFFPSRRQNDREQARKTEMTKRETGREKLREKLRTWAHWQEGNKWVRCWDVHCRLAQAHCRGTATCAAR